MVWFCAQPSTNIFLRRVKNPSRYAVRPTYTPNVLASLGGFAAGFRFDASQYEDPILVSCTDGVGTKLRLAIELDQLDTVGNYLGPNFYLFSRIDRNLYDHDPRPTCSTMS